MLDINQFPLEWNVIPAGKGKKYPEIKWDQYKEEKYPRSKLLVHDGNVAVVCGGTSNNLFVVDLDYKGNMNEVFRERAFNTIYNKLCEELPLLAKTRVHKTPHGHHILYYFESVPKTEHFKNLWKGDIFIGCLYTRFHEFLDGVDIQGDKALAIIPPSNVEGLGYSVYIDEDIKKLTKEEYDGLKQFFLLEDPHFIRKGFLDIITGKVDVHTLKGETGKDEHVYWKMLYTECYYRLKLIPEDLFGILQKNQKAFNEEKTRIQLNHVNFDELKPMNRETYIEYFPMYARESPFNESTESHLMKDMNVKQLTDLASNMLIDEFDLITLNDSRQTMVRMGSYYDFNLDKIKTRLKEICDMFSKGSYNSYKKNVFEMIADSTLMSRDIFCTRGDVINFKNGVYDVMNEVLISNDSFKEPFFYCIPWEYHEGVYDCPMFKSAINDWVMKTVIRKGIKLKQWTPIIYNDIFEMIGLCLSTNTGFKKAFLNYGPTHSGKTQFLNLISYIIGKDNCCSVKLHRLSKNEFGTKRLQMKLLNACGEIPRKTIRDTDLFKELTGDDFMIPSEIKGGEQFEFKNYATFWFNANDIPPLDYIGEDAFFERFILNEFPNQFRQENAEFELQFWEQLTDDYEIQGILHEAMKGLKRLIERKGFRIEITKNTKHIWLMNSDPVYRFLNQYCIKKKGKKELTDDFYEMFNEVGDDYLSLKKFTIELAKYGIYKRQLRHAGSRAYFYINVELKDVSLDSEEDIKPKNIIGHAQKERDYSKEYEEYKEENEGV